MTQHYRLDLWIFCCTFLWVSMNLSGYWYWCSETLAVAEVQATLPYSGPTQHPRGLKQEASSGRGLIYWSHQPGDKLQHTVSDSDLIKINCWCTHVLLSSLSLQSKFSKSFTVSINPTRRGGAFNARPKQKLHFWHLFVIQMTRKNLTFPKYLWQCLPYSFGGLKWQKKGFL